MIGFIGLGNMGLPMARNLLKKGQKVMVYDVVEQQLQAAVSDGAIVAGGIAEIGTKAKTVVTMLPEG